MDAKVAQHIPRAVAISDEERAAATEALDAFKDFLKDLNAAQEHDETLTAILKKVPEASADQMYEIRHLLIRFQGEVRENYRRIIPKFSAAVKKLDPLLKDTETSQIKSALVDTMQRLSDVVEMYMEAFDDFSPEQAQNLIGLAGRVSQLVTSIRSMVEHQLREHFKKNVLKKKQSLEDVRLGIMRRARLIRMFGGE